MVVQERVIKKVTVVKPMKHEQQPDSAQKGDEKGTPGTAPAAEEPAEEDGSEPSSSPPSQHGNKLPPAADLDGLPNGLPGTAEGPHGCEPPTADANTPQLVVASNSSRDVHLDGAFSGGPIAAGLHLHVEELAAARSEPGLEAWSAAGGITAGSLHAEAQTDGLDNGRTSTRMEVDGDGPTEEGPVQRDPGASAPADRVPGRPDVLPGSGPAHPRRFPSLQVPLPSLHFLISFLRRFHQSSPSAFSLQHLPPLCLPFLFRFITVQFLRDIESSFWLHMWGLPDHSRAAKCRSWGRAFLLRPMRALPPLVYRHEGGRPLCVRNSPARASVMTMGHVIDT